MSPAPPGPTRPAVHPRPPTTPPVHYRVIDSQQPRPHFLILAIDHYMTTGGTCSAPFALSCMRPPALSCMRPPAKAMIEEDPFIIVSIIMFGLNDLSDGDFVFLASVHVGPLESI